MQSSDDLLEQGLKWLDRHTDSDVDGAMGGILILAELIKEIRLLNDHVAGVNHELNNIAGRLPRG